ncbi:MAG TPA: sigma-70 family RNA polymerase sigma factor, partial [Candidatus Syntrophosphaera sp.]|nr:sigma-70 family RNA polymerase sigma factor [Candidatus Syntrophosphaera sp.]
VPLGKSSSVHWVKATRDRMYAETGLKPSNEELSEKMNITEKSIEQLQDQMVETTSYDELISNGDFQEFTTRDMIADDDLVDPQQIYHRERLQHKINRAIEKLDQREADIIRTYYGLNAGQETQNFARIAEKMGLSRERVRQIQKEALKKILSDLKPEEDALVDEFIEKYST